MSIRNDISPDSLSVDLREEGIEVEYTDGRSVLYRGVPTASEGTVRTGPGRNVHVLVTDPTESEGVLTYVNDQTTHDDILESTGVGRVILDPGEETTVFPGVAVRNDQHRVVVDADVESVDGRVFVFEEDEMGERSYEIVAESDEDEHEDADDTDAEDA